MNSLRVSNPPLHLSLRFSLRWAGSIRGRVHSCWTGRPLRGTGCFAKRPPVLLSAATACSSVRLCSRKRLGCRSAKFRGVSHSVGKAVGAERQLSGGMAEKNYSRSVLRGAFARRAGPTGRNTATTGVRIQQVSFGQIVARITGPGRRCNRQFGSQGGTPHVPNHVNPALRRPWTRETGRSVEQAPRVPACISTHRCHVRAAHGRLCSVFPSHPRVREGQLLKGSLPLCSRLVQQLD